MIWWLLALASGFAAGAVLGAPFLPTRSKDVEALLDLAGVESGDRLLDLGAGDGRLLKAAARRGAAGVGYEINPLVYACSVINCWPYRHRIKLRLGDYWRSAWPEADVIVVFLIDRYMVKLDRELIKRLKRPTRVASYVYEIPGRRPVKSRRNAHLYRYSGAEV